MGITKLLLCQEDKNPCFGNWVLFSALWVQLQFPIPSISGKVRWGTSYANQHLA